jgi:hypothetical protein
MQWYGDGFGVSVDGVKLNSTITDSGALLDLPADLPPGAEISLAVTLGASWKLDEKTGSAITSYITPRLWWGSATLSEYEVRLTAPAGYVWGASGQFDAEKGVYVAERARAFRPGIRSAYRLCECRW